MLFEDYYELSERDMIPKMANEFYKFAKNASKTYKQRGSKSKKKSGIRPCVSPP